MSDLSSDARSTELPAGRQPLVWVLRGLGQYDLSPALRWGELRVLEDPLSVLRVGETTRILARELAGWGDHDSLVVLGHPVVFGLALLILSAQGRETVRMLVHRSPAGGVGRAKYEAVTVDLNEVEELGFASAAYAAGTKGEGR